MKLKSPIYRVVNPTEELMHTSWDSMPFFLHLFSKMDLSCLPHYIDVKHPKEFEGIIARELLDKRLKETKLKAQ